MAKFCLDANIDAMLAAIAAATHCVVCSGQPANYAGVAAVELADQVITAGDGNGDWTIGDGDTSGRKVTMSQQADITIDNSGTATHVAWHDGSTLLYVTTCTSQALTAGGTVTVPAVDIEVADPS